MSHSRPEEGAVACCWTNEDQGKVTHMTSMLGVKVLGTKRFTGTKSDKFDIKQFS